MTILLDTVTNNAAETESCGATLAKLITDSASLPRFVALYGDLGVGKTAFVRGFTSVIAPDAIVRSPTFAIVNEYRARPLSVFHFDLYRIEDEDSLYAVGFYDYLDRPGICLTEWTEHIPYALPDEYLRVTLEKTGGDRPDARHLTIAHIA